MTKKIIDSLLVSLNIRTSAGAYGLMQRWYYYHKI